jgi:hypothetical protein
MRLLEEYNRDLKEPLGMNVGLRRHLLVLPATSSVIRGRGKSGNHLLLLISGIVLISALPASAQCPAVGADSTCGAVITVTDTGATVSFTGQGPYDGNDDTLVGVINNSSLPIVALGLSSSSNIFGFDGDGLVAFGVAGNPRDPTGYGGPNAFYTNINGAATAGIVNFITPIAAKGGTGFFGLENALTAATACSTIINNSLKTQASGANICATFTPNQNFTISQAAQLCGFKDFDWVQQITVQFDPSEFSARNTGGAYDSTVAGSVRLTSKRVPWSDPPQGGGYAPGFGGGASADNSYPFYYDQSTELAGHEDGHSMVACTLATTAGKTLTFHDAPSDGCLPGGVDNGTAKCTDAVLAPGVTMEPAGSFGGYLTHLAGVNMDGTATDLGIGFTWTSNYNGSTGSVTIKKTELAADGNGTGGVTIFNVNQVTNYQFPKSFGVTSVNGLPIVGGQATQTILGGNQVSATGSGLAFNRVNQTFNGTITITNVSTATINGPFQVVLVGLTSGVTLANGTGSFGGFPYSTVPGVSSLAPGESATFTVQFRNPSFGVINFVPITYIGSFN